VPIQAWQGGERQWRDEDSVAVRLGLCDRRIPDQRITARAVLYYDRCVPRFGQIVARSACQRVVKSARRIRHNNAYWPLRVGVCGLRLCDAKRAHCEACRRKECGKRFRDHFCLLDPWVMSLCNSELHYVARPIHHRELVENGFVDFNPQAWALRRLHTSVLADFKYGAEHVAERSEERRVGKGCRLEEQ